MTRRVTLVVNPSSGKGRAQELLPHVAGRLRDGGLDLTIQLSRDYAEARALIDAAAAGGGVVAVMGGDGMMHLGLNAVAEQYASGDETVALAMIPAGTGNDLCRGLGLPPGDAIGATQLIVSGRPSLVDVMEVAGRRIGTVLATGFDALVNRRANALAYPKGSMRYPIATLAELRVFSPLRYQLVIDGEPRDLDAMLVAVANTSCYGGGIQIAPDADPRDGRLDLTIIHPVGRFRLLRLLPKLYTGDFVSDPCVERLHATEVQVDGPGLVAFGDGELLGATPLTARIAPAALPVFTP